MIDIRQIKVSYTSQRERGEMVTGQPEKPIEVRSKDGYTFPVDVRITYKIDKENAPRVVANIGDNELVLNKIVTPKVRAIFRNNAGKVKALDYVQNRGTQEKQSADMLKAELEKEGVTFLSVNIGDVGDEKSLGALLKTQTDREIAVQQQTTFEVQQLAAEKQKALKKTEQEAEEEKRLATAAYSVKVAEEDKKKRIIDAEAEAEQIKLVAQAKAKAYEMVASVIGADNAALVEIMKMVATDQIQITPDVMVGGAGAGTTDALMGTVLRDMLNKQQK
jgi:regulator of protease activity HflC (stomatin/prohibitin superfamily)